MSSHQDDAAKTGAQSVEIGGRLLDDIVGAGSEPISFTIYQDRIDASTGLKYAVDQFGSDSPQARAAEARLKDVISRLHPMDR